MISRGLFRIEKIQLLSALKKEYEDEELIAADLQKRIVKLAQGVAQIDGVYKSWKSDPGGLEWEAVGFELFKKYLSLKDYKKSFLIGSTLSNLKWTKDQIGEGLVLSALS